MKTILLISPYWREPHRWMVSSYKLADLWQQLGYRVVVACLGSETKTEKVSKTLTVHTRKDFFLKDPFNYGISFRFFTDIFRILRTENPDIIVVNKILFWTSIVLLPLRLTGRKVILITDVLAGMTWWWRSTVARFCGVLYAWTLGWLLLLLASKVVFFHPQPSRLLRLLGIARTSTVIPTGIDSQLFTTVNHDKQSDTQLTITYVGRLESVKGVDDYLASVKLLLQDFPEITAKVVGWYRDNHPLVNEYQDVIVFTGLRDDIPDILTQTDIFVLPSYSEGLSNALMEAMSSGCACVASSVGGNRYLIQHGVSGFLFCPGDRATLENHLRRLVVDSPKRKALGNNARQRIEKVFDWQIVGEKYKALFTD